MPWLQSPNELHCLTSKDLVWFSEVRYVINRRSGQAGDSEFNPKYFFALSSGHCCPALNLTLTAAANRPAL